MGLETTVILVGIVLGFLQLIAGVAIGRYFPFHAAGTNPAFPVGKVDLEKFARRVGQLVNRVADDVGQHQARIAQVNRELTETVQQAPLADVVLGAIAQVVDSNARLQHRLTAAEEKLQRQSEQIQSQVFEARTDPLTELPNRRAFRDELERRIAQWHRKQTVFSLMMLDVDHFKTLNDHYGHPAGDQVLRAMAEALKGTMRQMDLVARVGGEEFAVILPETGLDEAALAAERVRTAVESHAFCCEQRNLHVTVSLGVAVVEEQDNAVSLIKRADEALYASKRAGRNCGHFHDGESCQRIYPDTPPTESPPPGTEPQAAAAPPDELLDCAPVNPAEDPELAVLCQDLRARLAEVASGRGAPIGPQKRNAADSF